MNIRELINQRILVKSTSGYGSNCNVDEVKVLEVSPSGTWAKLMNIHRNKYWKPVTDIALIEVLITLHADNQVNCKEKICES